MNRKMITFLISVMLLAGCTQTTLKAPCNATGSDCGKKIKINQWMNQ